MTNAKSANAINISGWKLYNDVKLVAERLKHWEVTHFVTLTFYNSSPASKDREHAIKSFKRWCISVAQKVNNHCIPIASIGLTERGRWHIHALLLFERDKRRPKYRELRDLWWKGQKRGRSENKLYQSEFGAIPYTLNHEFYLPIHKPFCPGRKKCRKAGCVKAHHQDIVRTTLRLTENGSHLSAANGNQFVLYPDDLDACHVRSATGSQANDLERSVKSPPCIDQVIQSLRIGV